MREPIKTSVNAAMLSLVVLTAGEIINLLSQGRSGAIFPDPEPWPARNIRVYHLILLDNFPGYGRAILMPGLKVADGTHYHLESKL